MKIRLLLFGFAQIIKEVLTAWFLFTQGVFHLSHTLNVTIAVISGLLMAALVVGLVRLSSAAHSDPDSAWVGWIRFILWAALSLFATALTLVQPLAGAPALALVLAAGWFTIKERRQDAALAEQQRRDLPTVPTFHVDEARDRYRQLDDRGAARRSVGPDRASLIEGDPRRGRRTGRALSIGDSGREIVQHL